MKNNLINYVELKANDITLIKVFYSHVFYWTFTDYGPDYTSFADSGIAGGFENTNNKIVNGVLLVIYNQDLEKTESRIIVAGGKISKPTFSFPGGHRFHFTDPSGNELAVWTDQ